MKGLKEHRLAKKWTALELSRATGNVIGEMKIYALERGRYRPTEDEITALSKALDVAPEKLFPKVRVAR